MSQLCINTNGVRRTRLKLVGECRSPPPRPLLKLHVRYVTDPPSGPDAAKDNRNCLPARIRLDSASSTHSINQDYLYSNYDL